MHFYPAIDIKNGQFIRLKKGRLKEMTVYGNDPVLQAKKFCSSGAKWIHVVDIDGAFEGASRNMETILKINNSVKSKIQVGGGVREIKTIEKLINAGIARVVLGTIAITNPKFVKEVCKNFPNRIAIGLDTKKGLVATEGWEKSSNINFENFLEIYEDSGVSTIIFTDIDKDGLMEGTNYNQLTELLKKTKLNVIASGGVASLTDLKKLKKIKVGNLIGVISGKAIYEKQFTVQDAVKILENSAC